ncbi:short-chain dehydrogenase/reductase-like protein [Xylogone sp. PMI_703]|nr:short-chain dehydrogenase/reductase-like protein [Xylogone sp. PMI_703]
MSRYDVAHANPQGPGDARPTALQIIQDEGLEGQLTGKVIVITGTSSGIGVETARALYATSATLYLTARDIPKTKEVFSDILGSGRVEIIHMDLTSFASVRAAAQTILEKSNNQVNILINNAGVMAVPERQLTKDGHEMQFGINHLAHFLLFQLLKPALLASSTPQFHSRVVNLSSSGHRVHGINDSDNYDFQKGDYDPWVAYGQSKTANIYMANEIERRYGPKGLHATAVHPGAINTPLLKYMDPEVLQKAVETLGAGKIKSIEQGAATTVWAAAGKEWANRGGRFLEDISEAKPGPDDGDANGKGYVPHAYDPEKEARLWKDSLKLVGLEDDQ